MVTYKYPIVKTPAGENGPVYTAVFNLSPVTD